MDLGLGFGLGLGGGGWGWSHRRRDHEVDDIVTHGGEHNEEHAHRLLVGEELQHAQEDEQHGEGVDVARQHVDEGAPPLVLARGVVDAHRRRGHDQKEGARVELVPEVADVPVNGCKGV